MNHIFAIRVRLLLLSGRFRHCHSGTCAATFEGCPTIRPFRLPKPTSVGSCWSNTQIHEACPVHGDVIGIEAYYTLPFSSRICQEVCSVNLSFWFYPVVPELYIILYPACRVLAVTSCIFTYHRYVVNHQIFKQHFSTKYELLAANYSCNACSSSGRIQSLCHSSLDTISSGSHCQFWQIAACE
jgi:hypothetical protein